METNLQPLLFTAKDRDKYPVPRYARFVSLRKTYSGEGRTPTANTYSTKIKIPAPLGNRTPNIQSINSNYTELRQVPIKN
jgi:hypothetical protein